MALTAMNTNTHSHILHVTIQNHTLLTTDLVLAMFHITIAIHQFVSV
jgi:hypothetical protein